MKINKKVNIVKPWSMASASITRIPKLDLEIYKLIYNFFYEVSVSGLENYYKLFNSNSNHNIYHY